MVRLWTRDLVLILFGWCLGGVSQHWVFDKSWDLVETQSFQGASALFAVWLVSKLLHRHEAAS